MTTVGTAARPEPRTAAGGTRVPLVAAAVAVGALGFVLRLLALVRGGGLLAVGDYDDGVYYAAASALVHGRPPYGSFLFIQPPGIVLAAAPFAAIGAVLGDPVGTAAGRLAFEVLGGVNAVLVLLVLRRFGWAGALAGGVLYAVFQPATYAERSILLEPLGTFGVLLSLLLVSRARSAVGVVAAGAAMGWALDVKIWYAVAAVVVLLLGTGRRGWYALGVAAAVVVGSGPFLLLAPSPAFRMIVLDQLDRTRTGGLTRRLAGIVGAFPIPPFGLEAVAGALLLLLLGALVVTAATRGARVYAALLAADGLVLVAAPSWFPHYAALTAPPLALCVGVAVQRGVDALPATRRVRAGVAGGLLAVLLAGWVVGDLRMPRHGSPIPPPVAAAMQRVDGCVTADDPTVLAVGGVLSRDLADPRCIVWPDVTGWTYDAARPTTAAARARPRNAVWQRTVLAYLESGRATAVIRSDTGLSAAARARLHRWPVLAGSGRWALLAVPPR